MGVDGFSVWLVVLTAFMTPVAIVSSWGVSHRVRLFMALTLLLETAIVGSFLALDLLLFFVFFEALLVPMFLVIGMWGSARRVYASLKFFLYTMAGSAFLLLAIVYLWFQTSQQLAHASFDIRQMERLSLATDDAALAVPGLLHRVRGQGADLPAAHVAARRAHRGADERLDRPGGAAAEGRDRTACSGSTSTCSPRRRGTSPRRSASSRSSASSTAPSSR